MFRRTADAKAAQRPVSLLPYPSSSCLRPPTQTSALRAGEIVQDTMHTRLHRINGHARGMTSLSCQKGPGAQQHEDNGSRISAYDGSKASQGNGIRNASLTTFAPRIQRDLVAGVRLANTRIEESLLSLRESPNGHRMLPLWLRP